jgi:hypothetical protein
MWRSSARGAGPSASRRSRSRRSSSSGLMVGGYAVEPSLLPDVPFAIYGMADIGRSEMLRQEADPANDDQCDTGNEEEREKPPPSPRVAVSTG